MDKVLERINLPLDLKQLTIAEMNVLAAEIRGVLIDSVAACGGHLASNLGVVELTIALHYVFDTPYDKIIWDVGHQSYTHKILTGRKERMNSLRQFGGLSGFPKHEESVYDVFNTGHSSTSISAALGMALARDIQKQKYAVVAVTGDGAMTGGMTYEALNHAGNEGRDLIVILNDNEMSISKNVGAMSSYLNRLRTDPSYSRTKEEVENVLTKIPGIGPNIARAAGRLKDTVKYLMVPGIWFEELGFTYVGPINGHDFNALIPMLKNARKMKGPVLIHTITEKGRGYEPARKNPDLFHGVGPFDIETGQQLKKALKTYTEIFGETMVDIAARDERVVAITAAMTSGTGLTGFARQYPERFFDVGICEQHAVTMAAGMARVGLKPVVSIYSTFLQRAYDQIIHDVALQNLPVVLAVDRAGLVGEDGPTHHGIYDLSYLRHIPNMTILAPANENEFVDMLHTALAMNTPVALRYPRGAGEGTAVEAEPHLIPAATARILSPGHDLAILAIGRAVGIAADVAQLLKEKGVSAELVNARFLKPLDTALITDIGCRFKRIVTIEDNAVTNGFGTAVLEALSDQGLNSELVRIGIPDEFIEHGRVDILFDLLNMEPETIVERVLNKWPEMETRRTVELRKIGKS
ncbi:MAG: 1-deoxy-D-xylulose-5-phosphate synthase [Syntrophomonadaceae bacterium]|nr:1-deoxy-D-xylulose-5-phosphate synthase [Syntrophomonadaceae bacterium]